MSYPSRKITFRNVFDPESGTMKLFNGSSTTMTKRPGTAMTDLFDLESVGSKGTPKNNENYSQFKVNRKSSKSGSLTKRKVKLRFKSAYNLESLPFADKKLPPENPLLEQMSKEEYVKRVDKLRLSSMKLVAFEKSNRCLRKIKEKREHAR